MRLRLASAFLCLFILSCNSQYKNVVYTISRLPPEKLLDPKKQGTSIPTSKIDSIYELNVNDKERFDFILDLDKNLKTKFNEYKGDRTEENLNNVVERINQLAVEKDITVDIKIKTQIAGATVKYKTQASQEESTAHNLTNECFITLYIGNYYIWTERSDKKTSAPTKYFVNKRDSITIPERIKK